ncbi:MAG: murein biosynthesis integral membrane protein MurJ [Phycisphaerales bacterium]|nr:murein biosynthesis integral membrane protein MurJ [Phycisphaerales bacterium]
MAFERHARTVSLLTLLSRITGVGRDAAISRVFGAGMLTDAFFFAFLVPNLFRRLFGEGALAAAFLPAFSRLDRDDPARARSLATITIGALAAGLGVAVLIAEVILFLVSMRQDHANLAVWLTMIMLPYTPLVCVVAVLGALLQVRGRFGPTAAAPVLLNGCLIAAAVGGAVWLGGESERERLVHIGLVAAAVIVAGVFQVAWSLIASRPASWWTADRRSGALAFRRMGRDVLPMILGLGVLQVNTLLDGLIASYPTIVGATIFGRDYPLAEGSMAAVSFAQRLYQFPLGVFGIAVATAIFPALARLATDAGGFASTVQRGLRLVVFIGLPASAGLIIVRSPLAAAILEGGHFGRADTERVSFVLLGYAPAIWAYSMVHVCTRAFYARHETMTPVRVAVAVVALNLVLNCTLIWTPLRESALAWSTAVCAVVQAFALLGLLGRRIGPLGGRVITASWIRTAVATAVMTAAVMVIASFMPDERTWATSTLWLGAMVVTGLVVYATAAFALRMPELSWALGRARAD